MTIPTLMSILSAPGTTAAATSAVAGAELPGSGEVGFACLVRMLLDQQQAPTAVPGGTANGEEGNGESTDAANGVPSSAGASTATGPGTATTEQATGVVAIPAAAQTGGTGPGSSAGLATQAVVGQPGGATPANGSHHSGRAGRAAAPSETSEDESTEATPLAAALGASVPAAAVATTSAGPSNGAVDSGPGAVQDSRAGHSAADSAAPKAANTSAGPQGAQTGSATSQVGAAPTGHDADPAAASGAAATTTTTTVSTGADPNQVQTAATVGVSAPTSAAAHTTTGPAPATGPVPGQVFPEVVRLMTRGDGTQRLTLRLSPENLGEVRIVVTVRDGGVDVRLAAGAEAQDALRHGSADLRRLLESAGATSTQILVRDLPGGSTATLGSATVPSAAPAGNGASGTYADSHGGHARDHQHGDPSGHRSGHQTSGPAHIGVRSQPATSTAPAAAAGLDLRL